MNARRSNRTQHNPAAETSPATSAAASTSRPRHERVRPARRDNPTAPLPVLPPAPSRSHVRQPRTYTTPEFAPRRKRPREDAEPTPQELDRWDAEWRDEWDRGDVDDSAAYDPTAEEEQLDVAEQSRDIEWLLDALDALDDTGEDDAYEWE